MKGFKLIRKTEPLDKKDPFVVIYGQPGVGKTSLSFTMPSPVLHLDFDKGVDRAVQKVRPDSVAITSYGDFHNYVFSDQFEQDVQSEGWKSVVLDTVGTLLEDHIAPWLISKEPKNSNNMGGLSLTGWGALGIAFNNLKGRLQSLGLQICAVAHGKEEGDGDKQIRLAVKGGSSDIIYRSCDMMGYMYIRGNDRVIDFNPRAAHMGKNVARLPITTIPDSESDKYDVFLDQVVVQTCINRMKEKSLAQLAFNKEVLSWKKKLSICKTTDDFDLFIGLLKESDNKLLKVQVKKMLGEALKKAKMVYNKKTESVECIVEKPAKQTKKATKSGQNKEQKPATNETAS